MKDDNHSYKAMKWCAHCNKVTQGEPLYCNHCGRSYDVKLCPRRHVNPRNAEACSQCGSRDLSTPQPRIPGWVPIAEAAVSLVPGVFLAAATIGTAVSAVRGLAQGPGRVTALLMLVALGILWWAWSEIPQWFHTAIYRMLKRRQESAGWRRDQ